MASRISQTLRKSVAGVLRLLITIWVISLLLTASAYVVVTEVFASHGVQLVSGAPIDAAIGITTLGLTARLHWPVWSTDEEANDRKGRVWLTLKKAIVATLRFLIPVWVLSLLLRTAADSIVATDVISTGVPWPGGIPIDVAIGITALALTVKLLWPVWPTDEEMKSLFSSSSSSSRSTGRTTSQQTGWKDPVDPDDPMEGMHMGGETELATHEPWETVEQSPYNDPDDAPGGLDTADDDDFF